jgi:serine/threonine-protein kinase
MFLDEARLSAHLSHSNCVQVFDIGVGDNAYFIVMEYVDGADLKAVLETLKKQGRRLAVEEAAFIALKTSEGLCYAHELTDSEGKPFGVVHRDVSPPNVLMTKYGEIKIVDFGLAKASSQLEKSEPGIIKGKFSYLSPEAALGKEVDHRTDIFAVGILLWEMLAAQRLFLGESDFATVKLVQQAEVPQLARLNPMVTPELERIVAKALARDPAQRFSSARDFANALTEFLYHYGKPVGSFRIASLVQSAVRDRQRIRPKQPSIIDRLIEEALFEFTSLQENESAAAMVPGGEGEAGSAPLSLSRFPQGHDWAREITIQDRRSSPTAAPSPQMIEEGNLAALEEGEDPRPIATSSSHPPSYPTSSAPPAPAPPTTTSAPAAPRKGSRGAVAFMVVLVVLAVTVGAYYTGLLPGAAPH